MGIALQIVLLAALMFLFARHEADISWPKLFLVFVPLIVASHILGMVIGSIALLVYLVCMIVALNLWFYLRWEKAALIAVVHVVLTFGMAVGWAMLSKA